MRRYLVDTTPLAALVSNRPPVVALLTPWMRRHEVATSILVYGEVLEGLRGRSDYARRHADLLILLSEIAPYPVTHAIMQAYAELHRQLRSPYGPGLIGDIDTLIAATAIEFGLTLVTTDTDFLRVSGLKILLLDRTTLQPLAGRPQP